MVPRSLFGRLVLVLLAGLLLAQLASAYLNVSERDRLLYRAGGMQLAQRIADVSRLLDSMPPAERRRIVEVFNAPPLAISLDRPPLDAVAAENDFQLAMFSGVLRFALGEGLQASVVRRSGNSEAVPDMSAMHRGMGGSMGGMGAMMQGASFTVQVALRDGTRVTFDSYLSAQDEGVPWRLAATLIILVGTVLALSLVAVRWVTRPLSTLATAAEKLGEDINRPPLAATGPTEVRRAAKAFNTMQSRLARFIADRTRIFAAMSHDLKTPLTRIRLRTELLEDEALRAKFAKDVDEMESMIAQTLDFMRDATSNEPAQPVDMTALLESLQTDYQDAGHAFELAGGAARPIPGRPRALRRCLTNLIDNAIRYGQRARIEVEERPSRLAIRVLDEGPGIPEAELERAFEPFFRGEASRSRETGGTGLGLGIARNIARAHGGEVTLKNRSSGGLEATLVLPRA
ncbi:MAG: HAMP domain-containing protein [Betaproteobacteria bacterium]|nr:MAG: HAMP domain-containing protein [Betaproteobacteria bacterium]